MTGKLPDFLICGVKKGGTTSLAHYLGQHPEIWMHPRKEIHFFSHKFEKGLSWYIRQFGALPASVSAVGEASPSYFVAPKAPERIAAAIPDVRLIFCLRDPVERARSAYWFNVSLGIQDPSQPLMEAVRTEFGRKAYLEPGHYAVHVQRFLDHFGRGQCLFVMTEDLGRRPGMVAHRCYRFLGVSSDFEPATARRNVTGLPKNEAIQRILIEWRRVRRWLQPHVPEALAQLTNPLRKAARRTLLIDKPGRDLSAVEARFLREHYAPEVVRLSEILEVDFARPWGMSSAAEQ